MDLLPRLPVMNELSQHDEVQEYRPQASDQPREALHEIVMFCALQQDTRDVGQVTCHGKDEQRERETLALGGSVLNDLWDTRGEVEDRREPSCYLGIPSPADGFRFWDRLLGGIVVAVTVFCDPPCSNACGDDEECSESVHDDRVAKRVFVVIVGFGGIVVFDDAVIADKGCALVGFERGRDGGDFDSAVIVFGVVPVLEDEDAIASAVVERQDDLQRHRNVDESSH